MIGKWRAGFRRVAAFVLMCAMIVASFDVSLLSGALTVSAADIGAAEIKDGERSENWYDRTTHPTLGGRDYMQLLYSDLDEGTNNNSYGDWLQTTSTIQSDTNKQTEYWGRRIFQYTTGSQLSMEDLNQVYKNLKIAYDAFLMDHPKVFWLTEQPVFRAESSYSSSAGTYTYNFYLVLKYTATGNSYEIRKEGYRDDTIVSTGIESITDTIKSIPVGSTEVDKIKTFYEWLINNNAANAETAASGIAGECISALSHLQDSSAPDSAGFARAMKVLCNNAGIPCVVVNDGSGKMWNSVYLSDTDAWYAVDVYEGKKASSDAINYEYLLAGTESIISGATFGTSHSELNRGPSSGFDFWNGPEPSTTRYALEEQRINGLAIKAPTKGKGTKDSPYVIERESQLFWFSAYVNGVLDSGEQKVDAYAILQNDIRMTTAWMPIGANVSFTGVFDGGGHTISALRSGTSSTSASSSKTENITHTYNGLFGSVEQMGVIKNLGVTEANFSGAGTTDVGIICGKLVNGATVEYCYTSNASAVGDAAGIVGTIDSGSKIRYSYTTCQTLTKSGSGTLTNAFHLASSSSSDETGPEKTAENFASGAVTYLLNAEFNNTTTDPMWYQNIDVGTPDAYPLLGATSHGRVYKDDATLGYSNKRYPVITFSNTTYVYKGDTCLQVNLPEDVSGNYKLIYKFLRSTGELLNPEDYTYTEIEGEFTSATLTPGAYYVSVTLEGASNYSRKTFYTRVIVNKKDITNVTATLVKPETVPVEYTGTPVEYEVLVQDGGITLEAGKDYELTQSGDLTNVGTVTLTITGRGDYEGQQTVTFEIVKKTASIEVTGNYLKTYTYTGNPIPSPTNAQVTHTNTDSGVSWYFTWKDAEGNELSGAPTNAGTYTLVAHLRETANYAAAEKEYTVTINRLAPKIEDLTWIVPNPSEFDNQERTATIASAVGLDGFGSITVSYKRKGSQNYMTTNPVDADTYEVWAVIAEGQNYAAAQIRVTDELVINPKPLTTEMFNPIGTQYYKGIPLRPEIISTESWLTPNDYSASWVDNTEIGAAYVVITGRHNYTGSVRLDFNIEPKTLAASEYYRIIGTNVSDRGDNWYKGEVRIVPYSQGYTIWKKNASSGSDEIVIKDEGMVTVEFYLKDTDGFIYYPQSPDGTTYQMASVNLIIDASGPDIKGDGKGLFVKEIRYNSLRSSVTFNTIDKEPVKVEIRATDSWAGLKNIYYYLQRVDDNTDRTAALTKDELEARKAAGAFQILPAPDADDPSSNKDFKAGFTINTDGKWIVYAYAEDTFGNESDFICSDGITIDRTPPVIQYIISPTRAQGTLSDIDAEIRFGASEPGTYYYTVKKADEPEPTVEELIGGTASIGSGAMVYGSGNVFRLEGLEANTEYIVYVAAIDKAENQTEAVKSEQFKTCKKIARFNEAPVLEGIYGTPVKDMELSQPESNNEVAGHWEKGDDCKDNARIWHVGQTQEEVSPGEGTSGDNNEFKDIVYEVQFIPDDTENCEIVTMKVTPRVNPRPVTISINDATRKYKEEDPKFTYEYEKDQFIGTDTNTITEWITITTDAVTDSDVGTYPIHGANTNKDYDVSFVEGTFTITKATADIAVEAGKDVYEKTFGDEAFVFEGITTVGEAPISYVILSSKVYQPRQEEMADGAVVDVNGNGEVKVVGAGKAVVRLQIPESKNYYQSNPQDITIKVAKHEAVDTEVDKKYVYAAGSKDQNVELDVTKLIPSDMGATLYGITGILDTEEILAVVGEGPGIVSDGEVGDPVPLKALISAKGQLTYQVNKLAEDAIGQTAEIEIVLDTANYEQTKILIRVVIIDKIDVMNLVGDETTVQVVDAAQLTYGMLLGDVALNTDSAVFVETGENGNSDIAVKGLLEWQEPGMVLKVSDLTQGAWRFTPEDTETYKILEGSLFFPVEKAVPDVTVPTAAPAQWIYNPAANLGSFMINGTNGSWTVGGEPVEVEGIWSWEDTTVNPTVDVPTYTAVFTPEDDDNYAPAKAEVSIAVSKAVPYIAVNPETAEITYGQTLKDAVFTGGAVQYSADSAVAGYDTPVTGTFSWREEGLKPEVSDSVQNNATRYVAVFVPDDTVNYEELSFPLTISVVPAEKPDSTPTFTRLDVVLDLEYIDDVADDLLPEGWVWDEKENWALQSGKEYYLTAIYKGPDSGKGNYVTESVKITVKRAGCAHTETEFRNKKDVTCLMNGYTGDKHCKICGDLLEKGNIIEAKGHTWDAGKITVEPTCTEDGTVLYTCLVCGATNETHDRADVMATGHVWAEEITRSEATCTEPGYTAVYCVNCDTLREDTYEEIPAKGHEGGTATCTDRAVCDVCGKEYGDLDPENHPETELRNVAEATCSAEGNTGDTYCTVCNRLIQAGERIEKIPHTWQDEMVTKLPTCVDKGLVTSVCAVCGEEKHEEIAATGVHVWNDDYTIDRQPTTTTEGVKSIHCKVCNTVKEGSVAVIAKVIPPKGTPVQSGNGNYTIIGSGGEGKTGTVEYIQPSNSSATSITIPASVTVDGISYQVTSIAAGAFKGNKKLTSVTIGNNVTTIGKNAFANCTKLKKIKIGNKVTSVGDSAFSNCIKLTSVTIGSKVTSIGAKAFYKCTALTSVTIPANVTKIGKQAFSGCKKLKTVTIKAKKWKSSSVGSKAFSGIYAKATIKVPKAKLSSYKKILRAKGVSSKAKFKKF